MRMRAVTRMRPAAKMRAAALSLSLVTSLAAKSYSVDGIVVALDPVARTMLVSHRPIGHYMPAMAMPFQVEDGTELKPLHPGMRIRFELVVGRHRSFARKIEPGTGADEKIPAPMEQLRIGDTVPEASLTDEQGQTVQLTDLRGKVLAIDFLYTRCPLPDVCPRLSANFATLQKRFAGRSDLALLSITVDPDYDTPAVLAAYAKRWGADPQTWKFLTGDIRKVAGSLGEIYWIDEGSIGHNSSTAVIGRDGRLKALVEGSNWRVEQLGNLISYELENTK